MNKLEKAAYIVLKECMNLRNNEKLLIVYDKNKEDIAGILLRKAKEITNYAKKIKTKVAKENGEEPPKDIADKMLNYNVILLITTKSLSHTNARRNANKKGARIASMPGITESMMKRALNVNYNRIIKLNRKIQNILNKGKFVKIITQKGTNLSISIKNRKGFCDNGLLIKKSKFGNLPAGEVSIAPLEGTANGICVIDASTGGFGKLDKPIRVFVKDGYATKIIGGNIAKKLNNLLKNKNKNYRNIAELGIGTNYKAKISGNVLEDEKVIGTCHIALGNNISFGGNVNVKMHIDGVIKKTTIVIDNKKIMDHGKLLI